MSDPKEWQLEAIDKPELKRTRKYDRFLQAEWNRAIDKNHAKRMAKMPLTLRFSPILVQPHKTKDGLVILDGQHRFLACKIADVPVHYIVDEDREVDPEMVIDLNRNQTSWSEESYINFWAYWDVPSYVYTRKLMDEHGFSTSAMRGLFAVGASRYHTSDLHAGHMEIYDSQSIESFVEFWKSLTGVTDHYTNTSFTRALSMAWRCEIIDNKRLRKRLRKYPHLAEKRSAYAEQFETIVDAYNHQTNREHKVGYREASRSLESKQATRREQRKSEAPEYPGRGDLVKDAAE